jgi:methanogenic corrinoid protein MtbC1
LPALGLSQVDPTNPAKRGRSLLGLFVGVGDDHGRRKDGGKGRGSRRDGRREGSRFGRSHNGRADAQPDPKNAASRRDERIGAAAALWRSASANGSASSVSRGGPTGGPGWDRRSGERRRRPDRRTGSYRRDTTTVRRRLLWALRRGLPLAIVAAIAIAMLVARPSAPVIAAIAVLLACIAMLVGWLLGEERRAELQREIESRTSDLKRALSELEIAQAETVRRLSMAVEFRDEDTGAHIERIGRFSALLAERLHMDRDFSERLSHAAPLHDVGKVAIPDAILLKPGPLTPQERSIVETHTEEGHRLLRGSSSSILDLAATIALSHHEKWDGGGYPRGLVGEAIPIEGRIVAIADVFDALTSDRVYRKAFTVEEAVAMMTAQRGKHFDPGLLDAFFDVLGSTGPEAKQRNLSDPEEIVAEAFEHYLAAVQRGDAETAEGVVAQAIEDGLDGATIHELVIGAAISRVAELRAEELVEPATEQLATGISRRILATMHRYMLRGADPNRERVLVIGLEEDDPTLSLQMIHDQLSAAGYQTTIDNAASGERLETLIASHAPELVVVGATVPPAGEEAEELLREIRSAHPNLRVVLSGEAIPEELRSRPNMRFLHCVGDAVPTVEELLGVGNGVFG